MDIAADHDVRFEAPPQRASPRVISVAEWRRVRLSAEALAESCTDEPWFVAARAGLGRRGGPLVRVFVRWASDELAAFVPVRWKGVMVVVRQPSGRDVYVRDMVEARRAAASSSEKLGGEEPPAAVLHFPPAHAERS